MQIFLGQAPPQVWWGVLILLLAVAASIVIRSCARLAAVRGHIKVALAALGIAAESRETRKGSTLAPGESVQAGPGSSPG